MHSLEDKVSVSGSYFGRLREQVACVSFNRKWFLSIVRVPSRGLKLRKPFARLLAKRIRFPDNELIVWHPSETMNRTVSPKVALFEQTIDIEIG